MLVNCEVIVIFPIYGQVEAISKPNLVVCKTYIFINFDRSSYKNCWKQNRKSLTQLSHF